MPGSKRVIAIIPFLMCLISICSVVLFSSPGIAMQGRTATFPSQSLAAIASETPTAAPTAAVVPTMVIITPTTAVDSGILSVVAGGIIGIVGAVAGSLTSYWLEDRRQKRHKRMNDIREALEWARKGRKESLRRADLQKADLRGADLEGADLAYADLRRANLTGANLKRANLHRADLRGANLAGASLLQANLEEAKAWGANLAGCDLFSARHLPLTNPPVRSLKNFLRRSLMKYWHIWESCFRCLDSRFERCRRRWLILFGKTDILVELALAKYGLEMLRDRETEVTTSRVVRMFLSNLLMIALAIALVSFRDAWVTAIVIVITGIPALNMLLVATWRDHPSMK